MKTNHQSTWKKGRKSCRFGFFYLTFIKKYNVQDTLLLNDLSIKFLIVQIYLVETRNILNMILFPVMEEKWKILKEEYVINYVGLLHFIAIITDLNYVKVRF